MSIKTILQILQSISAVLLIVAILLQSKGAGLGNIFGGEGNVYRTKRGAEKTLFIATIVLAVTFVGLSVVQVMVTK